MNDDGYTPIVEETNTGIIPPPNGTVDQIENVGLTEGESVATSEPVQNVGPPAPNVTTSVSGLSVKQAELQAARAATLEDMRAKYAQRFSNTSVYPKPPKAKAYHASGLTTIRKRDGEAAYQTALKDIMDKNDPAMGNNGMSQLSMTRKKKKTAAMNTVRNTLRNNSYMPPVNTVKANTAANRGTASVLTDSIKSMGSTAKELIDTMISTTNALAHELAKTGNTAGLTQVSNMAASAVNNVSKLPRKRSKRTTKKNMGALMGLPPIPEENATV